MYESGLERYVCEKIQQVGGKAFKWVCPGIMGAPDRICIFPGGRIIFMELKRPGRKNGMSARQKKFCVVLEKLGCSVYCINSKEEICELLGVLGYEV